MNNKLMRFLVFALPPAVAVTCATLISGPTFLVGLLWGGTLMADFAYALMLYREETA